MELKEFISETILQIASGVIDAKEKCKDLNVIVNPDLIVGANNDYFVPNKGTYSIKRRVQMINMDICVTVSESEKEGIEGKVGIKIFGIGANSTESKDSTNESRVRFSIPVCLPITEVEKKTV